MRGCVVAASVGPYGAPLAGGQEYTGDDEVPDGWHERRLRLLLAASPDCIRYIETQPRLDEAVSIVRALERLEGPDAWVTFTCRDGRSTAHGEPIEDAVRAVESPRVVAVGVNCTAPQYVDELLSRISGGIGPAAGGVSERRRRVGRGGQDVERRRGDASLRGRRGGRRVLRVGAGRDPRARRGRQRALRSRVRRR